MSVMWNAVKTNNAFYVAKNTPVQDIAVLVTDMNHPRFGQLGALVLHDWQGGMYDISFIEGCDAVPDLLCFDCPVKLFDRTKDSQKLVEAYTALGIGKVESLKKQYGALFRDYLI